MPKFVTPVCFPYGFSLKENNIFLRFDKLICITYDDNNCFVIPTDTLRNIAYIKPRDEDSQ